MDWWPGVLGNIVASLIGTGAGYYAGIRLFRHQLQEEEKARKKAVCDSLIAELKRNKKILQKYHDMYEDSTHEQLTARAIYVVY